MLHYRILSLFLAGLLVVVTGCTSAKPVQALVTLDGKPVDGATVVLTKEGAPPVSGQSGSDGIVVLDTATKGGVPAGDYKVVVTKVKAASTVPDVKNPESMKMMMKAGAAAKNELPAKYENAKSTPLTLKIPPDTVPAKIELTK